MGRFKKSLVFLIIYILLVSSVIQFAGTSEAFSLMEWFFPALTLAMVMTILVPLFEKWPLYTVGGIWLAAYLAIWFGLGGRLNQDSIIILLMELVFLFIGVLLARETTISYRDLELTLDKLIFANFSGRALLMEDAEEEIKTELTRSRRYHRPLSLVVFEPDSAIIQNEFLPAPKEMQQHLARRYVMAQMAEIIDKEARRTDLIIKQTKPDRFIVLCPETQSSSTNTLIRRIIENVQAQTGIMVGFGVASFPEEALTFEELVNKADTKLVKPGDFTLTEQATTPKLK